MTDTNDRDRRIKTAKRLTEYYRSGDDLSNAKHRQAWIHDQLAEAVQQACTSETGRRKFTQAQTEALVDIAFFLVYLLDAKNHRRAGGFTRLRRQWLETSLAGKASIAGVGISILATLVGAAFWLWRQFVSG